MFCKFCGKELPDGSKFCRFCGNKLTKAENKEDSPQKEVVTYAGFWIRLAAYCVDYSILFFLTIVILMFFENDWSEDAYGLFLTGGFIIYSIFFLSTWSKTPGKSLLNLIVINDNDRSHLSGGQALKRSLLQILSTLFFGIGYWNMGKDEKKQAFHDKKAETVVIQTEKPSTFAYIVAVSSVLFIIGLMIYGYS